MQCVGVLAQALGVTWKAEASSLVQPMMATGLSQSLVKTLQVTDATSYHHIHLSYAASTLPLLQRTLSRLCRSLLPPHTITFV